MMQIYSTEGTVKFVTAINTINVPATASLQFYSDVLFK